MAGNFNVEQEPGPKGEETSPKEVEATIVTNGCTNGHTAMTEERLRQSIQHASLKAPLTRAGEALVAELDDLGLDMEEVESAVQRYQQKEVDFISQMHRHFEDLRRNQKSLQSTLDSLESENSAFRLRLQQQETEHEWMEMQDQAGQEQIAQTERRIQALMDKLVVLLNSGYSAADLHDQLMEDLQGSISKAEVKLKTVQTQLDDARQQNRGAAVRLSEEQRKTKRLHDQLCETQGDLFSRKFCSSSAPSSADNSTELGRFKPSESWWTKFLSSNPSPSPQPGPPEAGAGIQRNGFVTDRPRPCLTPASPESTCSSPGPAGSPGLSSRSIRDRLPTDVLQILEEKLQQVLTRVAFEDEVIRMTSGIYRFGNDRAFLRLSVEGEVYASYDNLTWEPIAEFVDALRARRGWHQTHSETVSNGAVALQPVRTYVAAPGGEVDSPGRLTPHSSGDDAAGHALRIPPQLEQPLCIISGKADGGSFKVKSAEVTLRAATPTWTKSSNDKIVGATIASGRGTPRRYAKEGSSPLMLTTRASRRQDVGHSSSSTAPVLQSQRCAAGTGSFASLGGGSGSLGGDGGSLTSISSSGAANGGGGSSASSLAQQVAAHAAGQTGRQSSGSSAQVPAATPPLSTPMSPAPPGSPCRIPAALRVDAHHATSSLSLPRAAVRTSGCMSPHPAASGAAAGLASAGFRQSPCRRRPSAASAKSGAASHSNSPARAAVVPAVAQQSHSLPGSVGIPVAMATRGGASSTTSPPRSSAPPSRAGSVTLPVRAGSLTLPVRAGSLTLPVPSQPTSQPSSLVSRPGVLQGATTLSSADATDVSALRPRLREVSPVPSAGSPCANVYRGPSPLRPTAPPVSNPTQLLSAHAANGTISIVDGSRTPTPVAMRQAVRASSSSPTPRARNMYVQSPQVGGGRPVTRAITPQHVRRT
mmetsp:Transcript_25692/g.59890  ORF Transcript_25692/g.59890 Transcript_25692/m.59890 type:complete len:930 (+) Transcript_25692:55-2844(+)